MDILVLSDNKNFIEELRSTIKSIDKTKATKLYISDFGHENIIKIKKYFDTVSTCIVFSTSTAEKLTKQKICDLTFVSGVLSTKKVQIISNIDLLSEFYSSRKLLNLVQSKEEILDYITKKYKTLLKQDIISTAKKKLFAKGIPFTADCFASSIAKNKTELCNLFISAGIDIDSRDELGTPMLNVAVRNDNEELTKMLLDCGANINAVSNDRGYTAVMDAVWKGNKDITKILIERGAELNTISKEGQSNLVLAVGANNEEICRLLAENGADPDIKDQMGMSAFNYATLFKKVKILEILKPYHKE